MSRPTPAVSVLMTAYNRQAFVGSAIESVLAQRFSDFELVIVDDCSTDQTLEIAQRYAAMDSRIRVFRNERNLGDFANRNRAATYVRGRFLKYHDSDDVMYPHCLEIMVGLLDAEPCAGFGLSAHRAWSGGPVPMLSTPRQSYQREFMGAGIFQVGPACALFRTDTFRELGGWPEEGVHSDTLLLMNALARYAVLLMPADLFWYRIHEGQELQSSRAARDYARLPGAIWRMLHSDQCPLDGPDRERALSAHAWSVAKQASRDVKAGRFGLAAYRLRNAGPTLSDWVRYLRRPSRSGRAGAPLDTDGHPVIPGWLRLPGGQP
jgi:glycosyltransferase involved in cell wall biosynthesis